LSELKLLIGLLLLNGLLKKQIDTFADDASDIQQQNKE